MIEIKLDNKDLFISGDREDLIELADYIKSVALSQNEEDHLHLDELTLISSDSSIKSLVIEKK